eukprot:XP_001704696.1 Hypothetical protein GL50803_39416 [Giardia lamblia ATCC 50803]
MPGPKKLPEGIILFGDFLVRHSLVRKFFCRPVNAL